MDEKADISETPATKEKQLFSMAKALTVVGSTSGFIFGPLLIIGGAGWFIADTTDNRLYLFLSLIIALAVSNVFIFKYTHNILQRVAKK